MMKYLLLLILVLATCWAGKPFFEKVEPEYLQPVPGNYRLPDDVVPTNYEIELTPYLNTNDEKNFTFEGHSVITLDIKNKTKTITFHAKQLEFKNISLIYSDPKSPFPKNEINLIPNTIEEKDFVTVTLEKEIEPNFLNVQLVIDFTGVLNNESIGFYRSSYQEGNNTRWLATTQFEPVGARKAFPCWDEPAIKATFDITINVPKNYHAVSNMLENENKNGKITFPTTQKMSTYLVAFVVSDYEKKENKEKNVRVWTKPNAINSTEFALEIGQEALNKLKEFTGIDYYNPNELNVSISGIKMDQISIPNFGGAMENWGLVTYDESALLYTPGKSTTIYKQSIATVIAHEFAHQWFGNLVTCDWWDYIWLNEGFATFFEYYTTEQVVQKLYNESWRLMEQFVTEVLQESAFVVDATTKTRSLNSEVTAKTPAQINSLFDTIAYQKGGSILRMLQQIATEELFQKGLNRYLNDNRHKPVTPFQLLKAIEDADKNDKKILEKVLPDKISLHAVMDNWLNKPGYPVITVKRNTFLKVNLTQERFFLMKRTKQDTTQWYVPITYITEEDPVNVKLEWLKLGEVLTIDNLNHTKWVLFNKDQTGYYRVNYDVANWNLLTAYLQTPNFKNISASNRAQLIDDAFSLARAGYLTYNSALNITKYLIQEIDYIPWYAAVRVFDYLDNLLRGTKNYDKYQAYVVQRIRAFAKEVNYTSDEGSHVTKLGKILALHTACKYGYKDCENFAKTELKEWLEKKEKTLSPDLKSEIICAALRKEKNLETWNKVVEKYKNSQDKIEQEAILYGLACARSKEIVSRFLELSIKKELIIDIFSTMNLIATGNAESFDILLDFIALHTEIIIKADEANTKLPIILHKLAAKVTTAEQYAKLSLVAYAYLQDIEKFAGLNTAIENLAWINFHLEEIENWIKENYVPENNTSFANFLYFGVVPYDHSSTTRTI